MKKIIASAFAVLLSLLGIVTVDKTIEERVSTLESQVSSLSAEKETTLSDKIYKVGDKISCFPETPYSFDSVVGYGDEITVCIDSFTAEIIGIDELNTEGETITQKFTIQNINTTDQVTNTTKHTTTTKPQEAPTGKHYSVYNSYKYSVELEIIGKLQNIDEFRAHKIEITFIDSNGFSFVKPVAVDSNGSFAITTTQNQSNAPDESRIGDIKVFGFA